MRKTIAVIGVFLALVLIRTGTSNPGDDSPPSAGGTIDRRFTETVRPFVEANCVACHDAKTRKGDLDLTGFQTSASVANDLDSWDLVLEQLEAGTMPPAKAKKHPSAQERAEVVAWIKAIRQAEATRLAGDPGLVPARRLSNAEYDRTIRDLTGVDIRPTREFPVDPANEAGFDNSAESLTMSPPLVKKYLEAARKVADHLVLKPNGFAFAAHPVVADTDRDKYGVRRIIDFYKKQKTDYADYFHAAWRFHHRDALGRPGASLAEIAAETGVSPRYLATIWNVLTEPAEENGPITALQALWRELPAPKENDLAASRAGCEKMRDFVVGLRTQLVPVVKNLSARPIQNGSQTLVLWKNRQFVANRRRYTGGARQVRLEGLPPDSPAARAMTVPTDPAEAERFEGTFGQFCATFPIRSSSRNVPGSTWTPRPKRGTAEGS